MAWMDRSGKQEDIPDLPPHLYQNPRISPDGTRIAVAAEDQQRDIWIWDIRRQVLTPLTMHPANDTFPVWTRDSGRIVYASARDTNLNLWWQPADGSGSAERLLTSTNIQIPTSITPGGDIIFHEVMGATSADVLRLSLSGPRKPEPIVQTTSTERDGVVSSDGHWLAYESNRSNAFEIWVQALTGAQSQVQVSTNGGTRPVWGRDELFYIAPDRSLMRVAVAAGGTSWNGGHPTKLTARIPDITGSLEFNRNYDVSPDGQRFVVIKTIGDPQKPTSPPSIEVVQHWDQDVAARAPAK